MLLLALTSALALDPGPYTVGHRNVRFDSDEGLIWARVHYPATSGGEDAPADLSGGPYPVAAFLHGWLGSAWMYSQACDHLASLGLVVVNMDTETHPFLDYENFARDTIEAYDWVEARSAEPGHWLSGMADDGDRIAMGHSMGGLTLSRIVDWDPRVRTLVGFMPYESDSDADYGVMSDFDGAALYITGTQDTTATPAMVRRWFANMDTTRRGFFFNIEGAGHQAISNFEWDEETMADDEQLDVVLSLATDFLAAEVWGDETGTERLLFDPPAAMTRIASNSTDPLTSLRADGDVVTARLVGRLDSEVLILAGTAPGETEDPRLGTVGLVDATVVHEAVLPDGQGETGFTADETLQQRWFQVALVDGDVVHLGEPTDLFDVGLPDPPEADVPDDAEPVPGTDGPADDATDPAAAEGNGDVALACGGCASSGGLSWAWVWVPLVVATRRRRAR
jgi:dienelactone hydrolase